MGATQATPLTPVIPARHSLGAVVWFFVLLCLAACSDRQRPTGSPVSSQAAATSSQQPGGPAQNVAKGVEMPAPVMNLPKTVVGWSRPDVPQRIDRDNIFSYMDGGGELYLAYGFDHLDVYNYTSAHDGSILTEIYWMKSSDDGFGLLSGDWGGEPVVLGAKPSAHTELARVPSHRALYGAGLLRIWADDVYARVMAERETPSSRQAVIAIGHAIAAGRKNPAPPALVNGLPPGPIANFHLRSDRVCYFRSHLVLNSVFFLATENILNLESTAEAVVAEYARSSASGPGPSASPATSPQADAASPVAPGPVTSAHLVIVRYRDEDTARRALSHFQQVYFSGAQGKQGLNSGVVHVEDGWVGYGLAGRGLALAFGSPNQQTARLLVEQALAHL